MTIQSSRNRRMALVILVFCPFANRPSKLEIDTPSPCTLAPSGSWTGQFPSAMFAIYTNPSKQLCCTCPKKDSTPEAETLDSRTTSEASPQDSGDKSSALETGYIESSVMTPKDSKSPQSLKVISSGNFYHRPLENLFPAVGLVGSVSRMPQIPLVMTWTQQCSTLGGGSYDRACNLHLPMLCPSPSCKEQLSYKGFRLDGGPCMHVAFTSIIKFILAWPPFFMIHT